MGKFKKFLAAFTVLTALAGSAVFGAGVTSFNSDAAGSQAAVVADFQGNASSQVNGNIPYFTEKELTDRSFESYSDLDSLGRCGVAFACVGKDIMPTEPRGKIGMIKPTGWHQNKYPGLVDSEPPYLYNRCHLIGYQLTGENANEKNLVTGTRYMNVDGMLPYENQVANYVESTGNHVMYRVTPKFDGNNLLCNGVEIEAYSVEDSGQGVCFNVFCYNVQPGVDIDYTDGNNKLAGTSEVKKEENDTGSKKVETNVSPKENVVQESNSTPASSYIANMNTKKFHYPSCSSVKQMKESNKWYFDGSRDELISQGYDPCKRCNP